MPPTESLHRLLTSPSGLRAELCSHGALRRLVCGDTVLNLFLGNEAEGGPANLFLRCTGESAASVHVTPLLGPLAPTRFAPSAGGDGTSIVGRGAWRGLRYQVTLRLAAEITAWFWHVQVSNETPAPQSVDLISTQDLGLAPYAALRLNEYYVSQYIDHSPLQHAGHGWALASRQNQAADGRHPWCLIGTLGRTIAYATDALQVQGLASRSHARDPARWPGLADGLPAVRWQHEHAQAALQTEAVVLAPGGQTRFGCYGLFVADHPAATTDDDLARVEHVLALPEATAPAFEPGPMPEEAAPAASLFATAPGLAVQAPSPQDLTAWFGDEQRHREHDAAGTLLSFFSGAEPATHVVLQAKEAAVLRSHGHLLRSGDLALPDETALTSTTWMGGVFHSMLTQGHVSINRCLSTQRSYLGLYRSQGLRVFVEIDGAWRLLETPSAYAMQPGRCRWFYRHAGGLIEVESTVRSEPHTLLCAVTVREGPPLRCLIGLHIALNGDDGSTAGPAHWRRGEAGIEVVPAPGSEMARRFPEGCFLITPEPGTAVESLGGDELLYPGDGHSRDEPFVCIVTAPAERAALAMSCNFVASGPDVPAGAADPAAVVLPSAPRLFAPGDGPLARQIAQWNEILPWYVHNALIHYLAPRGLEQYSGGGWGTRDVCQGPVELLMALGRTAPVRDLLLRVMRAQAPDGDWPQWFMFFARDAHIRAGDSHGDIVYWPLLALAQYLIASGDAGILDALEPFHGAAEPPAPLSEHIARALRLIDRRVVAGTRLAAYGHGDWNDSLQPADPAMREHMCSAWTVTLHHQVLRTWARALRQLGREAEAAAHEATADAVRSDFDRLLVADGVLTGYAIFGADHGAARDAADDGDAPARSDAPAYLLHPRDTTTGVQYSALAMVHAIEGDVFDPAAARAHLALIDRHLTGPDGLRLFDRPLPYRGGLQRHFQRAESASFFGREIGLMYMHAHLRFAQALAHVGEAERFFEALCRAQPIGLQALVPQATPRQANCYYSSSDAAFRDRAQASADYPRIADGTIALDGGWRVYSSGAGIAVNLLVGGLLGLRRQADALLIDPVMPPALNGLRAQVELWGRPVEVIYAVGPRGCGVEALRLDGMALSFEREANPHRPGAAVVGRAWLDRRPAGWPAASPGRLEVRTG